MNYVGIDSEKRVTPNLAPAATNYIDFDHDQCETKSTP